MSLPPGAYAPAAPPAVTMAEGSGSGGGDGGGAAAGASSDRSTSSSGDSEIGELIHQELIEMRRRERVREAQHAAQYTELTSAVQQIADVLRGLGGSVAALQQTVVRRNGRGGANGGDGYDAGAAANLLDPLGEDAPPLAAASKAAAPLLRSRTAGGATTVGAVSADERAKKRERAKARLTKKAAEAAAAAGVGVGAVPPPLPGACTCSATPPAAVASVTGSEASPAASSAAGAHSAAGSTGLAASASPPPAFGGLFSSFGAPATPPDGADGEEDRLLHA